MNMHQHHQASKGLVLGALATILFAAAPAMASTDGKSVAEITVVAETLDTRVEQRKVNAAGKKQALRLIREQLSSDTAEHIDVAAPLLAPKRVARIASNRVAG